MLSQPKVPKIANERTQTYVKGSKERAVLEKELAEMKEHVYDVPCVINGKEYFPERTKTQLRPGDRKPICEFHLATEELLMKAIEGALEARKVWGNMPWEDRAAVFLKAADLLSTKYRYKVNAATMLGQGKNVWQAEIDSAAELIDFWRFNVKYMSEIYTNQPPETTAGVWNRIEYRPLEGFVLAITPFNFTAIGGNVSTAQTIVGNVTLWKPASTAVYSNYLVHKILLEAGMPEGVIQFLPSEGSMISKHVVPNENLAGIHFTGSTSTFVNLWQNVGQHITEYKSYPRIVGETGGKDYHFVHKSVEDIDHLVFSTVRGAFEYAGQKCSATSRMYLPDNLADEVLEKLVTETKKLKVGPPEDMQTFVSPVIDEAAFDNIVNYIEWARDSDCCKIIAGGEYDKTNGFFVQPTLVVTTDPKCKMMQEEIFGPVLTIYVYPADKYEENLDLCANTSPYGLTGSIFAKDRVSIRTALDKLRDTVGNFYVNDKSTGSVVGQQPFGGARKSGTNDKSGSQQMLQRWMSTRSVKESFLPITEAEYPHQK